MSSTYKSQMRRKDLLKSFSEPKVVQLQKSAHQEILLVGKDVERKSDNQQQEEFGLLLEAKIKEVMEECEAEKESALNELKKQFDRDVENAKKEALALQNKALKREAKRVEEIMDKRANGLVNDAVLEGQKNLDLALVKARENFDKEKEEAVKDTIAKQQAIATKNKEELNQQHQNEMDENNKSWQDKLEKELENLRISMTKKAEEEKKLLQKENDKKTKELLDNTNNKHQEEIQKVTDQLNQEQNTNDELRATIKEMEDENLELNNRIKTLVKTFQGFIESVPGFGDGQADFMLIDIIPDIEHICNAN